MSLYEIVDKGIPPLIVKTSALLNAIDVRLAIMRFGISDGH